MTDEDFTTGSGLEPEDRDLEAPAADAVEQATPADPAMRVGAGQVGLPVSEDPEVNEYDAVEQARVVDVSDEY